MSKFHGNEIWPRNKPDEKHKQVSRGYLSISPGSLQVERREFEASDEEEEAGSELAEWRDAREEYELEEEPEEVWVESRGLESSSEDGMHSHVSRSENLE